MSGRPSWHRAALADLRLVPAAFAAWLTGGLLVGAPSAAGWAAGSGWTLALAAVLGAVALRGRRGARELLAAAGVALAAVALVATMAALRADVRAPPALADAHRAADVVLRLDEEAAAGDDRLRGTASSIGGIAGQVPVLVVGTRSDGDLGIGTVLRLRGTPSLVEPGGAIAALVVADGAPPEVVGLPPPWLDWANGLRAGFRALAAGLPGDGGALLTGLAIGDDRGLPQPLADAMRTSSLTHLTAVSGANCALVVGSVMVGGALLGIRRPVRIAVALLALGGFVVLVTPQPSVVRAAVMAAFALVGLALARPMRGLPLLCLAVAGILVADPWAALEPGFALSVLATAGLLILSGPLARLLAFAMPYRLALAVAVPLAAQLACQPAIALLDPGLPSYGVVANLLAVPAAPLATVAGLLACLLVPVLPPLALGLAWLAWAPSSWIGGVATTFAGMPGARLPWPDGPPGAILYALLGAGVGVVALGRGRSRAIAALAVGGIAAVYAGALLAGAASGLGRPADWQVAMCDVGQGDAAVVRSAGRVAVVDTGPDPEPLAACLDGLGIGRIDLLVLSHFDMDHVGGTAAVVGRVDRVLTGPPDADGQRRVLDPLAAGGAVVTPVRRGDAGILGALAWQVLWPRDEPGLEPGNAASVVVRFAPAAVRALAPGAACPAGGCLTTLFLGDLGAEPQLRLLAAGPLGRVDVVKVSHHGSADQAERLYRAVAAPVAIIGVGADNDYGHPTAQLLGILARLGSAVGRTDTDGLLLVARRSDGAEVLWRERGG